MRCALVTLRTLWAMMLFDMISHEFQLFKKIPGGKQTFGAALVLYASLLSTVPLEHLNWHLLLGILIRFWQIFISSMFVTTTDGRFTYRYIMSVVVDTNIRIWIKKNVKKLINVQRPTELEMLVSILNLQFNCFKEKSPSN